jgi:hypothetical protein
MDAPFKKGAVSLLFKKGDQDNIKNYRPISLLRSDYKLFTKIITNRMSAVLSQTIGLEQTAFLPGRQITDNVAFAQLLQSFCTMKNKPGILAFLDQEKAYDRVLFFNVVYCDAKKILH